MYLFCQPFQLPKRLYRDFLLEINKENKFHYYQVATMEEDLFLRDKKVSVEEYSQKDFNFTYLAILIATYLHMWL